MIFSLKDISPKVQTQFQTFIHLKPAPQLPAWENTAAQLLKKGLKIEALSLLDIAARKYDKQVMRRVFERIFHLPVSSLGRGFSQVSGFANHPAIFVLRDRVSPCQVGAYVGLRAGANLVLASQNPQDFTMVSAFGDTKQSIAVSPTEGDSQPIPYIGIGTWLLFANASSKLTCLDLSNPRSSGGDPISFRAVTIDFGTPIRNLCGPLADGTFMLTHASEIPVLSDVCHLCHIDFDKISAFMRENPEDLGDIRAIGALDKDIILPNIEQCFLGDCLATPQAWVTCGGGMQNREVRFIASDGSWTTRIVHESPVIRVMRSEAGAVSLDASGFALLWDDVKPVAHWQFAFDKIPSAFMENLDETDFTIDWMHKRLYLTLTTPPQSTLRAALIASHSCRLDGNGAEENAFVKKIYHLDGACVAMLGDASFHFWDLQHDCVELDWQLPQACADQADWNFIFKDSQTQLETDPRIRGFQL